MTGNANYSPTQIASLIAESRLDVHFQPIVDLHDGLVIAYEALTRTPADSPVRDLERLFRSAERHGMIWPLEELTRRNAIAAAAVWPPGTRLFLNCTPAVFADPRFLVSLGRDLSQAPGLAPDRIVLEITELSEEQSVPELADQVRRVVAAGFQVALDDAGAGASGLNRMMALRPQWVKLDREFVRRIDRDALRQNLVRFFVHYARTSGVQVLAEGIESAQELQTVASLGVRFAQGYYLGKPGAMDHTTSAEYLGQLRSRWASVETSLPQELAEPTIRSVCRPMGCCEAATPIAEARRAATAPEAGVGGGLIVTESGRVAGWCSARAMNTTGSGTIRAIMSTNIAALPGTLRLHECLSEVVRTGADELADPIVVMSGEQPVGIVRLRDILRIVATEGRLTSSGRTGTTGLPGRGKADEHISEQIAARRTAGADHASTHADAAFIDVRAFVAFEGRHGRRRADQLVRDLAEMISAVVLSSLPDAFLAHLGEDRFLLTAPAGLLRARVARLVEAFDEQAAREPEAAGRPAVLGLCIEGVLQSATCCRDVYRLEQRLREQVRDGQLAGESRASGSMLVFHDAACPSAQRLAA